MRIPWSRRLESLTAWERLIRLGRITLTSALTAVAAATCGGPPRDPLADTVLVLDQSLDGLSDPSADLQTIFQGIAGRLPHADASGTAAIRRFLSRVPAAGSDFKCAADSLRNRAHQELIRLKETLLRSATEPAEPQCCYAAPFAIDPSRAPERLEISGFDFDLVPIEMFFINADGYHDVTQALIARTHYHLRVGLGGVGGARFSSNSQRLGLTWAT